MKTEFSFWLLLAILNCFLFVPGFLITSFNEVLIVNQEEVNSTFPFWDKLFYRFNFDIFRGAVEFTLLSIFFLYFKYKISANRGKQVLFLTYACSSLYLLYFQISGLVYQSTPLFFNDFALLFDTTALVEISDFSIVVWIICGFIVFVILILYLIRSFWLVLYQVIPQRMSLVLTVVIILFSIANFKFGFNWTAQNTYIPVSIDLGKNIYESFVSFKYVRSINPGKLNNTQPKVSAKFNSKKPNIHIVVIESYGEILLRNKYFKQAYEDSIQSCDNLFMKNGWEVVSSLSEAPMNGGSSKVSYGSLLYGFDFQNNGIYNYFYRTKKLLYTNHLGNHLRRIGYENYLIDGVRHSRGFKANWNKEKLFYAFDKVIGTDDINYKGDLVGYGPSVLGQYAYGCGLDRIRKGDDKPNFSFFFSRMLNTAFDDIEVYDHWSQGRVMTISGSRRRKSKVKLSKDEYLKSELYQLGYLTKTIVEMGENDDVFILIGDHQPFFYTTFQDSRRTPVHIISKNKKLLSKLKRDGFVSGMATKDLKKGTNHTLIYNQFMDAFYKL